MAHLVGQRERLWKVWYDTLRFDQARIDVGTTNRLFMSNDPARTNMHCAGIMPADNAFRLTELGLRADLDGPLADDLLRALLRSLHVTMDIGQKECLEIPQGGFYPPGMSRSVDSFIAHTEQRDADTDGVEIKPLVVRCADRDESAQLWADERNAAPGASYLYPAASGVEIGSRERLDIQLHFQNGRVTCEESNDGEDWVDITPSVRDKGTDTSSLQYTTEYRCDDSVNRKLYYQCTARYFRVRFVVTSQPNMIRLDVLARGNEVVMANDLDEPEPPWLRGGYCRFIPVPLPITIPPHQNFCVMARFFGQGARTLTQAQNEGLLRGDFSILLGGVQVRDLL